MKRMADMDKSIPETVDSDIIDDYSALPPEIGIYEISGPLFFASAKEFCEVLKQIGIRKDVMIIRMRHVPFVDSTGLQNFKSTLKILAESQTKIVLSGVNETVCKALEGKGIVDMVGTEHIFSSFDQAVEGAKKLAGK
jgi:SulP family sulfate permease